MRAAATWIMMIVAIVGMAPTAWASPEPTTESQLPAYDEPPPSDDEVPIASDVSFDLPHDIENPPTGRGHTAVGAILVGGSGALIGLSTASIPFTTDFPVWIIGEALGSVAFVSGVGLLVSGHLRAKKYRAWADGPLPARGEGLIAGGITCMVGGTLVTIAGGISLAYQGDGIPYGQMLIPIGLVAGSTGVGLFVAGARRQHFVREQVGHVVPSFSLLPGSRQSIGGLSLGFAGRF
jgi:hypothetical protein